MAGMNRQLSLPALQTILRDFERQNERMDMTSDVMGDAIDDAFEQEGEQEESEELVNQVRSLYRALLPRACSRLRRAASLPRYSTKLAARSAHSCWTRRLAARPPRHPWPRARLWPRQQATAWTATCSRGWMLCGAAKLNGAAGARQRRTNAHDTGSSNSRVPYTAARQKSNAGSVSMDHWG